MKLKPLANQTNPFVKYIESNFNDLRKKTENKSRKEKMCFNEDVFMDTIVKCLTNFSKETITVTEIEKYFWKAYKQNIYSKFSRDDFNNMVDFDDCDIDIIDEDYNEDIDNIVEIIKNEVKQKFGPTIYDAWLLHVCNNYTYTELEKIGYKGLNLHNEFRQIKRFIKKIVENNDDFKTLLFENNFISL